VEDVGVAFGLPDELKEDLGVLRQVNVDAR
jgi:hypothetical protein